MADVELRKCKQRVRFISFSETIQSKRTKKQDARQDRLKTYQWVAGIYSLDDDRQCQDRNAQIYHVTGMGSQREHKLDRLKSESEGAANQAPTLAVPMHAPQTNSLWRGVGEVSSTSDVGC